MGLYIFEYIWIDGYNNIRSKNKIVELKVDIDDLQYKDNYKIVDRWKELSEKVGFKFEHTVKMMLNVRPGVGNNRQHNALKYEGIYIFTKK